MGLTLAAVVLAAAGIHWILRREGITSPLRRRADRASARARDEEEYEEERAPPARTGRSGWPALRAWRDAPEDPPEAAVAPPPATRRGGASPDAKSSPSNGKLKKFPHRLPRRRPERPSQDDETL
jgi:hypothetical protein